VKGEREKQTTDDRGRRTELKVKGEAQRSKVKGERKRRSKREAQRSRVKGDRGGKADDGLGLLGFFWHPG